MSEKQKENNEADDGDDEITEQNTYFQLPDGLYHRIAMSDGTRTAEIITPASNEDLRILIDYVSFLYFLGGDEQVRRIARDNTLLRLNDFKKIAEQSKKE